MKTAGVGDGIRSTWKNWLNARIKATDPTDSV